MLGKFTKITHKVTKLPIDESLDSFAPSYFPEKFTREEKKYLAPFFSNVDRPVFVIYHLPEEVIGALSSRYSRSRKSLRRMFLDEYVTPVLQDAKTRKKFEELVGFLNKNGGIEEVANVQRARKFFDKWLAEYGDDSIAEMGQIHLCLEGISNVVLQELVEKRIGVSFLEKSTRYVSFADREPDGSYKYVVPGEIRGTKIETEYRKTMDLLFDTYTNLAQPYVEYIKERYPMGVDETPVSFENSRGAKRFDDIRDLLPFATKTNVAISGNGRVFEDLINRLLFHPLGEMRWWGQAICREIAKVVPSFVSRPQTLRGAQIQIYRNNLRQLREKMAKEILKKNPSSRIPAAWVRLLEFPTEAEALILSGFLATSHFDVSLGSIKGAIARIGKRERARLLADILSERRLGRKDSVRQEDRFRKVPRAFENSSYLFEIWGRGGDYRDLHRHRMATQEHQRFTTAWGYNLEREVLESAFVQQVKKALLESQKLFKKLSKISPDLAQYCVAFGFVQHWYLRLTAREIYWIVELRTSSQGRPHYRRICQEIARLAREATPAVFQGLMVDWGDYSLARRESEKKIEAKKMKLEMWSEKGSLFEQGK